MMMPALVQELLEFFYDIVVGLIVDQVGVFQGIVHQIVQLAKIVRISPVGRLFFSGQIVQIDVFRVTILLRDHSVALVLVRTINPISPRLLVERGSFPVIWGPNSIEECWLEFWLEKSLEFRLEIPLH